MQYLAFITFIQSAFFAFGVKPLQEFFPQKWNLFYDRKVTAFDFKQGQIANCFMMQEMKAVAYSWPQIIENNIETIDADRGQYSVKIFNQYGVATKVHVDIVMDVKDIDKAAVGIFEQEAFAQPREVDGALIMWPVLYEKAIIQMLDTFSSHMRYGQAVPNMQYFKRGYARVAEGGYPGFSMQMITGMAREIHNISSDNTGFSEFVTFLLDHENYPIALASSNFQATGDHCIRPLHIHPVGEVDMFNGNLEILCDEPWEHSIWLSFSRVLDLMMHVVSVEAPAIISTRLKDPGFHAFSLTKTHWLSLKLVDSNIFTISDKAYDSASVAMRLSQGLNYFPKIENIDEVSHVELPAPFHSDFSHGSWKSNQFQKVIKVAVDTRVQEFVDDRFAPGMAFSPGFQLYSRTYLVLRKAMEKVLEIVLPQSKLFDEREKLKRFLMMLGNSQADIAFFSAKVAYLRKYVGEVGKICSTWRDNSWIEIRKWSEERNLLHAFLRCGLVYVPVPIYVMQDYFSVEEHQSLIKMDF